MTLGAGAAGAIVGLAALLVVGWGAWLSVNSSRRGPEWARSVLAGWRRVPWGLAGVGVVMTVVVDPLWVGVTLVYIGVVTAWLVRSVWRRLEQVRSTYGGFDPPGPVTVGQSTRAGTYLLAGAGVLAVLGIWDAAMRGWAGVFGVALAACLAVAGLLVRRRA